MVCLNPITAWKLRSASLTARPQDYYRDKKVKFKDPKNDEKYEKITLGCGKCLGCRLDHANNWATRIMLESKNHKENCFITLTYNNEKLPLSKIGHMTLRKKDAQDFIKRLRYYLKDIKIKYFLAGEYGPATYRPHLHLIIMGWKPKDLKKISMSKTDNLMYTSPAIEKIWGNGYVSIEDLNYKTACYTARYVQKKAGIKGSKRRLTDEVKIVEKIDERNGKIFQAASGTYVTEKLDIYQREKEFILMSKQPAIGLEWFKNNKNHMINNNGILFKIDDKTILKPIPRYFKKIWEKDNWENYHRFNYKLKLKSEKQHAESIAKIDSNNPEKTFLDTLKFNLEKKAKLLKRNQI